MVVYNEWGMEKNQLVNIVIAVEAELQTESKYHVMLHSIIIILIYCC